MKKKIQMSVGFLCLLSDLVLCMVLCVSAPAADYVSIKGTAMIGEKTHQAVVLAVHNFENLHENYLIVTDSSIFYAPDGSMVSYKELMVPCHANIEYAAKKPESHPEVIRARVIEFDDNATADFTSRKFSSTLPR